MRDFISTCYVPSNVYEDSKQRADKAILLDDVPAEGKLKGLKHERDPCKKEEKLSKMKAEEKEWLFKDEMIKVSREEKSLKRIRELNKDGGRAFREEKDRCSKADKEKLLKEKSPKEEKLRLYKEERKKKSKDRPSKLEKKNDFIKRIKFQKRGRRPSKRIKKNSKKCIGRSLLLMNIVTKVSFWRTKTPSLVFLMTRIGGSLTCQIHPSISKGKTAGTLQ